jgi:hypothetical protein
MFSKTIKATLAIAIAVVSFSAAFVSFSASAQAYHRPIQVGNIDSIAADSSVEAHLQLSVRASLDDSLKFRVVVINPYKKGATITINKVDNDLTLYTIGNIRGSYQNLFNFSDLEDGNYELVVSSGKEKIRKEITISTSVKTDRQVQLN